MRRLAIHHPGGGGNRGQNVFGVTVANLGLFRALARHGGLARLDVLTGETGEAAAARLRAALLGDGPGAELRVRPLIDPQGLIEAGGLIAGGPRLEALAWRRRQTAGDTAWSLAGVIHTLGPPAMREEILRAVAAPVMPWDALICTSPAVKTVLEGLFDATEDHLAERTGGRRPPRPQLPVLPLGVEAADYTPDAARRARVRATMDLAPDELVVLWVGRLSYFEKAFPQPMMRAVAEAARLSGRTLRFVMAGWFPGGEADAGLYREAAQVHAPGLRVDFADGNDAAAVRDLWSAADIFLSLVDNVQETFGLTPIEAMAAGLPVVASDWDGYRATVRDGVEGRLIPTLLPPPSPLGDQLALSHDALIRSYQQYVGITAQHTAVDVGAAARALADLAADDALRRRMGEAARRRALEVFDWGRVAPRYVALMEELSTIRQAAAPVPQRRRHPARAEPFGAFAPYATAILSPGTRLVPGIAPAEVLRQPARLDDFGAGWRLPNADALALAKRVPSEGVSLAALLGELNGIEAARLCLTLTWLAKLGVLGWEADSAGPGAVQPPFE
ncbi:glycosyltransferase family 4 protein [Brevundimonas sp.]|uniref:glycosyltransferase family 4 protein n=1 Tax=Brevundimonas sp. TaxID=1871086 RepID=UPI0022C5D1F3|nr:glycosyltransferase family 4 protein [Brevundimonas sp.]MCZ8194875.1 glycosyltransferase family 4 protein [Brevundimonas sp.]